MIKISPRVKRIFLQRFLLSKFCYNLEDCELRDLCCIFENQLWLERKCQTDPEFAEKFGKSLEDLSIILKQINFRKEITQQALRRLSKRIKDQLRTFTLPKRNYKDGFKRCNGHFKLLDSFSPGVLKRELPPKTYVGKGYRDKGTVKNMAKDGSPSWQEVAMHRGPLYHKGRKIDEEADYPKGLIEPDEKRVIREWE